MRRSWTNGLGTHDAISLGEGAWRVVWRAGDTLRRSYHRMSGRTAAYGTAYAKQQTHDFPAALEAWEGLRARWPKDAFILSNLVACAREVGRLDYACALVEEALRAHPRDPQVIAQVAVCQERRGRWSEAAETWRRIAFERDTDPVWCHSFVHALLVTGRLDEAETLNVLGRRRFPEHPGFVALQAMLASERGKLDEALALWRGYRARFPDDPMGWEHYGRTYQAKQNAANGDAIDAVLPEAIEREEDAAVAALLMHFESIGHDCEFGLVQRRYGAEPLGLLRFNAVAYGDLLVAAANRFGEMGEPAVTELVTVSNGEYFVQDRRWGLGMHTFIFQGQADPDILFGKLCRRVVYLRDRFLEDLAAGRKILVFTCPGLVRDDLAMLYRAMRSLGPIKLLHVASGAASAGDFAAIPCGGIAEIEPGLFVGRLSREGKSRSGAWDIAFGEWVDLCGQVLAASAAVSAA